MRFAAGAVVGFAVGYYLGVKADIDRAEQLREMAGKVSNNKRVQAALEATEQQRTMARSIISGTLRITSKGLRAVGDSGAARS